MVNLANRKRMFENITRIVDNLRTLGLANADGTRPLSLWKISAQHCNRLVENYSIAWTRISRSYTLRRDACGRAQPPSFAGFIVNLGSGAVLTY